ncbi:TPA: hypothetical protein PMC32_002327 [Vibrio cholerae]|nr:hypothetical protein [Vibrio cholerae]HDI3311117.1 hypothetical protein [Vibrio cholerae]
MSKHKNYEMIAAKASNKSLVIFVHNKHAGEWQTCDFTALVEHEDVDFFLCANEHKSVILSGLNGAAIQTAQEGFLWEDVVVDDWKPDGCYMSNYYNFRIKPQERWIAITNSRGVHCSLYESEEKARIENPHADQFIKIMLEVPNE